MRYERGSDRDPWSFVENEADRGSGLGDFKARALRVEAGVFLSPDPVGVFESDIEGGTGGSEEQPAHRSSAFTYASGDPVNWSDRSGRWGISVGINAFAASPAVTAVGALFGAALPSGYSKGLGAFVDYDPTRGELSAGFYDTNKYYLGAGGARPKGVPFGKGKITPGAAGLAAEASAFDDISHLKGTATGMAVAAPVSVEAEWASPTPIPTWLPTSVSAAYGWGAGLFAGATVSETDIIGVGVSSSGVRAVY